MSAAVASPARHRVWRVAPLLLRSRRGSHDGRRVLTVLAVAAFTATDYLLLTVVGGLLMFMHRNAVPSSEYERTMASAYIALAGFAVVLLIVPLLSLGSAAARLGASRRERRLANLRLLGATPGDVVAWATLEVLTQAALGVVTGTALFYATAWMWHALSFQGRAIGATELLPAWWSLLAVSAAVLLIGLVSALTGMRQVRVTPLGVARRAHTPEVHVARLIVAVVLVLGWLAFGGQAVGLGTAIGSAVALGFLALLMAAVNAAGPYLVKLLGIVMARGARGPARLLAGRRLLQDPKAAWRAIAALALTSFIAGCTILLPAFESGSGNADGTLFSHDIVTGTLLTLGIAFVVTAISTGIAQAASILERAEDARMLALTGAPLGLQQRARRLEVWVPIAVAVVPSVAAALLFQVPLLGSGVAQALSGLGHLALTLGIGIALVVAAEEACQPLQRTVVAEHARRTD